MGRQLKAIHKEAVSSFSIYLREKVCEEKTGERGGTGRGGKEMNRRANREITRTDGRGGVTTVRGKAEARGLTKRGGWGYK